MRWRVDLLLVAAFAALTAALACGVFLDLDLSVRDWADGHRPRPADLTAKGLNYFGQGGVLLSLSVLVAGWLAWRTHSVRPLLPVIAVDILLYLVVGPVKVLTDRAAPHKPEGVPHREEFFSGGMSYPSGHVVNTLIWYGVLTLLLSLVLPAGARWALRIGPPAIVAVVTTYVGYHWFTDTVAGLLLGLLIDRQLWRVDWNAVPLGRRLSDGGWGGQVSALSRRAVAEGSAQHR